MQRQKLFENLLSCSRASKHISPTIIFYCAPHKLLQTLEDLRFAIGDIEIVIERELTKVHEEIWRGPITLSVQKFEHPKGEFVVLFRIV
jgi:16S rRNA (cytidine1402-2'-O)-methyltransferase